MGWNTLDDIALAGKIVLCRVDVNVPMDGDTVTDTTRIDKIVPTVTDILDKGGKPVLLAHFDRPKGKVVPEMSLKRILPALQAALGRKVVFGADCVGEAAAAAIAAAGSTLSPLTRSVPSAPGRPLNFCQSPVILRSTATCSVGCAPTPSQYCARSESISMSEGSSVGWYLPISSMTRPSRLVRESATTIR